MSFKGSCTGMKANPALEIQEVLESSCATAYYASARLVCELDVNQASETIRIRELVRAPHLCALTKERCECPPLCRNLRDATTPSDQHDSPRNRLFPGPLIRRSTPCCIGSRATKRPPRGFRIGQ